MIVLPLKPPWANGISSHRRHNAAILHMIFSNSWLICVKYDLYNSSNCKWPCIPRAIPFKWPHIRRIGTELVVYMSWWKTQAVRNMDSFDKSHALNEHDLIFK